TAATSSCSIAEQGARLCDEHEITDCPACGSKFKPGDLVKRVTFQLGAGATSLGTDSTELEIARTTLCKLDDAVAAATLSVTDESNAHNKHAAALREIATLTDAGQDITLTEAESQLAQWKAELAALNRSQSDQRNEKQQV